MTWRRPGPIRRGRGDLRRRPGCEVPRAVVKTIPDEGYAVARPEGHV